LTHPLRNIASKTKSIFAISLSDVKEGEVDYLKIIPLSRVV